MGLSPGGMGGMELSSAAARLQLTVEGAEEAATTHTGSGTGVISDPWRGSVHREPGLLPLRRAGLTEQRSHETGSRAPAGHPSASPTPSAPRKETSGGPRGSSLPSAPRRARVPGASAMARGRSGPWGPGHGRMAQECWFNRGEVSSALFNQRCALMD